MIELNPSFTATVRLAENGGIPPKEKKITGQGSITLARKALEIHTQLFGSESEKFANDMSVLAEALDYFNNDGDDEVLRLRYGAKTIQDNCWTFLSECSRKRKQLWALHIITEQREHELRMILISTGKFGSGTAP